MNNENKQSILVDRMALCFSNYLKADDEKGTRLALTHNKWLKEVDILTCVSFYLHILPLNRAFCFSSHSFIDERFEELMGAVNILEASLRQSQAMEEERQETKS